MKLFSFLLLLGMMTGQEKPTRQVTVIVSETYADGNVFIVAPNCDDQLKFKDTTTAFRDIFPEECGQEKPPQVHRRTEYRAPIAAACDMNGDHLGGCSAKDCWCWHEDAEPSPEPPDVPAVQVPSEKPPNGPACYMSTGCGKPTQWCEYQGTGPENLAWNVCSDHPPLVNACADKTRGLWHDELPEPKTRWYCRKAQTE